MKKLGFIFCLILPLISSAQNVKTLKHQADSLRKKGKYQKAEPLYNEAIDHVVYHQEKITDRQWLELSLAAQQNHNMAYSYTDDKTAAYANWEYGDEGSKLKEKIDGLIKQGIKCVFTWHTLGGTGNLFAVKDSISGVVSFTKLNSKNILVWAIDNEAFMQEFNSSNVYKPVKITNQNLLNLLTNHGDELIHQNTRPERTTRSEISIYNFAFYTSEGTWRKQLHDPQYLVDPTINSNTYIFKLLPLLKDEAKTYRTKEKTE